MKFRDLGRFWQKVDRAGGPAACWPWRAHTDRDGHGQFSLDGQAVGAHRLAYRLATGERLPPGRVIRHICNNPACCNPAHLIPGTHAENVADRVRAERSARGENNGRHKLTAEAARFIRAAQGEVGAAELARRHGVTRRAVTLIWTGQNWREG